MMMYRHVGLLALGVGAAAFGLGAGCSAVSKGSSAGGGGGGARAADPASSGVESAGTGQGGLGGADLSDGGGNEHLDQDGDGFTIGDGDCNDNDRNVNPGAVEVRITDPDQSGHIPDPVDEDCDGSIDNVATACDDGLALDDFDPMSGARAIDLCALNPPGRTWGVIHAAYTRANGAPAPRSPAVGIFDAFGPNVHALGGARMLGISSGHARLPGQPGACNFESCPSYGVGTAPDGFPQDNPRCPPSAAINDDVALELRIRAPTNATGYEFRFKFYTFEYDEWVCDDYNDQFLALATPNPPGSYNGNLSFDSMGNPVSINIAFFDVCAGCQLGTAELQGTGFDTWNSAGGTGWLKTQAPVNGGEEITLRFIIFDTGDDQWDSTALIDGFRWIASGGTVAVTTTPVEEPR